jgi:hypothetical protein
MARNCPKNANSNVSNCSNSNAHESTASTPTAATITTVATTPAPAPSTPPPIPPKQSLTQQIRALEEKMTKEEQGNYLNACNMGEDFCSAGY